MYWILHQQTKFCDFTHQHSSASESHHAESAFEHKALKVGGRHLPFEAFRAVVSICLLSLSVRIVHSLHVLPQLIFPLRNQEEKEMTHSKNAHVSDKGCFSNNTFQCTQLTLNCLPQVEHRKSLRSEWRNMCKRSLSGRQKAFSQLGH